MRFFGVKIFNDGTNVSNTDINVPKNIICKRGGGGGDFTVIFKNRAIAGKKFVEANGFFLKV